MIAYVIGAWFMVAVVLGIAFGRFMRNSASHTGTD